MRILLCSLCVCVWLQTTPGAAADSNIPICRSRDIGTNVFRSTVSDRLGIPTPDLPVLMISVDSGQPFLQRTDRDGMVEFRNLPDGSYDVNAGAYQLGVVTLQGNESRDTPLAYEGSLLPAAPSWLREDREVVFYRGTVTDESGGVLPGVTVTATCGDEVRSVETTSRDGSFKLACRKGEDCVVEAMLAGFLPARSVVCYGQTREISPMRLKVAVVAHPGIIVGPPGDPLLDLRGGLKPGRPTLFVHVYDPNCSSTSPSTIVVSEPGVINSIEASRIKDSAAWGFSLSAGTYRITAEGPEGEATLEGLRYCSGTLDWCLRLARGGARNKPVTAVLPEFLGQVIAENGCPIEGAIVTLTDARSGKRRRTKSTAAGFRFSGLEPGRYDLRAVLPHGESAEVRSIELHPYEQIRWRPVLRHAH